MWGDRHGRRCEVSGRVVFLTVTREWRPEEPRFLFPSVHSQLPVMGAGPAQGVRGVGKVRVAGEAGRRGLGDPGAEACIWTSALMTGALGGFPAGEV